jgi:hypothetical protein
MGFTNERCGAGFAAKQIVYNNCNAIKGLEDRLGAYQGITGTFVPQ